MDYKPLEANSLNTVVGNNNALSYDLNNASFFATSTFIYMLLFSAILAAAFYQYILVGVYRMEASESGIRKSNETFKRATLGLLGCLSLFLIISALNSSLLTGDVDLGKFKAGQVIGVPAVTTVGTSGGSSNVCEPTQTTITKLTSPGGICGSTVCTSLSGCNYQQYLPIINQAVGNDAQLKKMIIVTMCKESRGDPRASHLNSSDNSYDCGLMQINQKNQCNSATLIDPANIKQNIEAGVALMKKKIALSSQVYQNIPAETGPFSAYNCCANGTVPNAPSVDCSTATGFPFSIPKWACSINPGTGTSNMCSVKSYVCELSACMKQL